MGYVVPISRPETASGFVEIGRLATVAAKIEEYLSTRMLVCEESFVRSDHVAAIATEIYLWPDQTLRLPLHVSHVATKYRGATLP